MGASFRKKASKKASKKEKGGEKGTVAKPVSAVFATLRSVRKPFGLYLKKFVYHILMS